MLKGGYSVASAPEIKYTPQNYVACFGWNDKISYLFLCYNVSHEYCFVDLKTGRIMNLTFSTVDEAEKWLYEVAEVYEKNAIVTNYIP